MGKGLGGREGAGRAQVQPSGFNPSSRSLGCAVSYRDTPHFTALGFIVFLRLCILFLQVEGLRQDSSSKSASAIFLTAHSIVSIFSNKVFFNLRCICFLDILLLYTK